MSEKLRRIWNLDDCNGCGMCVSACSKGVLSFNGGGHPILEKVEKVWGLTRKEVDTCFFCKKPCEQVCPRIHECEPLKTIKIVSGRRKGSSKDVITSLLLAAWGNGYIDGAIMPDVDRRDFRPMAKIATSPEEMMECAGYQYLAVPLLTALNDAIYRKNLEKIAIVGTPCIAQSVRRTLLSSNDDLEAYKRSIQLMLGYFCNNGFEHDLVRDVIVGRMEISAGDIARIEADYDNGNVAITLRNGSVREVPLIELREYTRKGCASCIDFASECADMAIGNVGAPHGYQTIIVRTLMGEELLSVAVNRGYLEIESAVDAGRIEDLVQAKRRRSVARERVSLILSALDALSHPERRDEVVGVIDSFVERSLKGEQ